MTIALQAKKEQTNLSLCNLSLSLVDHISWRLIVLRHVVWFPNKSVLFLRRGVVNLRPKAQTEGPFSLCSPTVCSIHWCSCLPFVRPISPSANWGFAVPCHIPLTLITWFVLRGKVLFTVVLLYKHNHVTNSAHNPIICVHERLFKTITIGLFGLLMFQLQFSHLSNKRSSGKTNDIHSNSECSTFMLRMVKVKTKFSLCLNN
jgi:hypothetical protein